MRKFKKCKRTIVVLVLIIISIVFYRYIFIRKKELTKVYHDPNEIEIHMIDVGQSESILIVQGENTMLIDTGKMFCGKDIAKYISKVGVDHIDILVITHFHNDHVGGAHRVISSFDVGKIICMDSSYISTLQERTWYTDLKIAQIFNEIFHGTYIKSELPYDEDGDLKNFSLGNAYVTFLSQEKEEKNVNNKSIVSKIEFGDFSALLMGDAESEIEEKLIESQEDLDVNLLKVGHHGSNTSSTSAFLEKVNPEYAIISCGKDNKYSFPKKPVLKRLYKTKDIKIYRTDLMGDIVVKSDGNNVEDFTER